MRQRIIIPAFNCARTLPLVVKALPAVCRQEILVVNDGSSDDTVEVAEKLGVECVTHLENRGYGAAQKTGFRRALEEECEYVVLLHGDHQYLLSDPRALTAPLERREAEAVLGSRRLRADPRSSGMPSWRLYGNIFLTSCQNRCLGLRLTDYHTGLRAYSRRLLALLPLSTFSDDYVFDQQVLVAARLAGMRILEVEGKSHYGASVQSISLSRSMRYGVLTLGALLPALLEGPLGSSRP